jgi:hypothetical protein
MVSFGLSAFIGVGKQPPTEGLHVSAGRVVR